MTLFIVTLSQKQQRTVAKYC